MAKEVIASEASDLKDQQNAHRESIQDIVKWFDDEWASREKELKESDLEWREEYSRDWNRAARYINGNGLVAAQQLRASIASSIGWTEHHDQTGGPPPAGPDPEGDMERLFDYALLKKRIFYAIAKATDGQEPTGAAGPVWLPTSEDLGYNILPQHPGSVVVFPQALRGDGPRFVRPLHPGVEAFL